MNLLAFQNEWVNKIVLENKTALTIQSYHKYCISLYKNVPVPEQFCEYKPKERLTLYKNA